MIYRKLPPLSRSLFRRQPLPPLRRVGFSDCPMSDEGRAVAAQLAVLHLRSQLNAETGVYEFCILAATKSMSVAIPVGSTRGA
jgi:hypothetical protein